MWETRGCLHGRCADRENMLFPVIFICKIVVFHRENGSQITYRNSTTLEVQTREKRVTQNVCKGFFEPPLFLMNAIYRSFKFQ